MTENARNGQASTDRFALVDDGDNVAVALEADEGFRCHATLPRARAIAASMDGGGNSAGQNVEPHGLRVGFVASASLNILRTGRISLSRGA